MPDRGFATTRDLSDFAAEEPSRGLLPWAVRRLVQGTAGVRELSMPAGRGIWRGGSDGVVECCGLDAYVPYGRSVWEMSNEKDPSVKAMRDYRKCIEQLGAVDVASCTFVFVTMRTWKAKMRWLSKVRQDSVFADVRAYDCEDLWGWLETQPAVHSWLSDQMGFTPINSAAPMELIPDVRGLVGRDEELDALTAAARSKQGALIVISGQPGIGKTALATRLAYDCSSDYPDGQLFIELRDSRGKAAPPEEALTHALRSFGVTERDFASARDLAAIYRSTLSCRRAIVVLDSAASEEQLRPLLPGASKSLVVVTSRSPLSALDPDLDIRLDVLAQSHAVELLRAQTGRADVDNDTASITAIAQACGGLPLALTIAARASRRASWSFATLARRLADERHRLDQLSVGDLGVRASFQLSYGLLRRTDRALFRRTTLIPGTTFDAVLIAAASGLDDPRRADRPIDRLVDLGLVVPTAPEGTYRLHDLIRLFGTEKSRTDGGEHEAQDSVDNVGRFLYDRVSRAARVLAGITDPALGQTGKRAPTDTPLHDRSDALRWFDRYINNVIALVPAVVNSGKYSIALSIVMSASSYLELRGYGKNLENLAVAGLAMIGKMRENEQLLDASALMQLEGMIFLYRSNAAIQRRRYDEALRYCQQADSRFDRAGAKMHLGNVRGTIFLKLHRYEEALAEFQAIERCDDRDRGHDLHYQVSDLASYNIGVALHHLRRNAEAMPYLERDLERCRAEGDQVGEATTLNTIGNAYGDLGDAENAIKTLSLAVERYEDCGDLIHAGHALNDLGIAFAMVGQHGEAIECHTRDMAICAGADDLHGVGKAYARIADNLIRSDVQNIEAARKVLVQARDLVEPSDVLSHADITMIEGDIFYAEKDYGRGRDAMNYVIKFYGDKGFDGDKKRVQLRHSACLIEQGYPSDAIDLINECIAGLDSNDSPLRMIAEDLLSRARQDGAP